MNGEQFVPKDVPIFNYDGTTYVPIRAVSEAFGLEVGYDADKNAAVITMPDPEVCSIYHETLDIYLNIISFD